MLNELLSSNKSAIVSKLASKLGVNDSEAGGFFDKAVGMISSLVTSGKLDLQSILKGDISSLTSALDMDSLGSALGGGREMAEKGLGVIVDEARDKVGDDTSGLLKTVGGLKGSLGKMFG